MGKDNKRKLVSEAYEINYDVKNLKKKLKNDEPIILEGIIQRANAKNQNNRIYTKEVLDREVQRYKETFIKENRALGELDHPDREVVEYKTASHKILDLWWEGDDLMGKIKILSGEFFPCANILRGCLKDDIPIGFSSRGYGSEQKIGADTFQVNDDYQLICWDAVTNPSTHGAFGGYINENMNTMTSDRRLKMQINNTISNFLS